MTQHITQEQIRAAGGIVHRDGNIFFTNIDQLNAALAQPSNGLQADKPPATDSKNVRASIADDITAACMNGDLPETMEYLADWVEAGVMPAAVSGWKLVPPELTHEMLGAACRARDDAAASLGRYNTNRAAYRALIAAAPTGEPG